MPVSLEGKLVVALSSRALFDFEEENRVFEDRDALGWNPLWTDDAMPHIRCGLRHA